jgi:cellulose biosynthesis protein BcsQ
MENFCMSKVIAVANTSGGSGKTTVAHALAVACAEYGKKTLLIDLDPKAELTFRIGRESSRTTAADFLSGTKLSENLTDTTQERFDFIGADSRLASPFGNSALNQFLSSLEKDYAIVILDLASSITPPLSQAVGAADLFLIPMKSTLHDLRGALQIKSIVGEIHTLALQIGGGEKLAPEIEYIDCTIGLSDEVEVAQNGEVSVLTNAKTSLVAENFREATYSILEKLELV